MDTPYFYEENILGSDGLFELSQETSHHCVRVLRMQKGDEILLTNGKGELFNAIFETAGKKHSLVKIIDRQQFPPSGKKISIAISSIKNAGRMEWFLEKATEIGINDIRFLLCERTERSYFKADRFKNIITGALIQSRQVFLPRLHEPENYNLVIEKEGYEQKLIAHCLPGEKTSISAITGASTVQILIGPEGDFSPAEVEIAMQAGYLPVSIGNNRLRTETAGLVAASILKLKP